MGGCTSTGRSSHHQQQHQQQQNRFTFVELPVADLPTHITPQQPPTLVVSSPKFNRSDNGQSESLLFSQYVRELTSFEKINGKLSLVAEIKDFKMSNRSKQPRSLLGNSRATQTEYRLFLIKRQSFQVVSEETQNIKKQKEKKTLHASQYSPIHHYQTSHNATSIMIESQRKSERLTKKIKQDGQDASKNTIDKRRKRIWIKPGTEERARSKSGKEKIQKMIALTSMKFK